MTTRHAITTFGVHLQSIQKTHATMYDIYTLSNGVGGTQNRFFTLKNVTPPLVGGTQKRK